LSGPWDTRASLNRYLVRARYAGISRVVLFPVFHSDYRTANSEVGRIVSANPDYFSGFAFVHPVIDRGRVLRSVQKCVEEFGFCGIKVHRHDGKITREVCEAARRLQIPVLYDLMGETTVLELLAQEYGDVNFVIPHLGSFADDWAAQIAFVDHLVRHANIYTDTSGVRRFDILLEAVRRAGAYKILFGSDGPWLHPGLELAKVRALGLDENEERAILGGNFLRLTTRRVPVKGP
jgi:uncharacterized protein